MTGAATAPSQSSTRTPVFLPYQVVPNWLPRDAAAGLLQYALTNEDRFTDGRVYHEGASKVDPALRKTRVLHDLGPFAALIREAARASQAEIERTLRVPAFGADYFEIELAAHGHGAHFDRHIDTFVGSYRNASSRVLTLVYYLLREPKAFAGGALRMHGLGGRSEAEARVQDIEPRHNQLVAFPSIAPHSVGEVDCPSNEFADSRFAVNIWIHRKEGPK
jgi:SM-20-related protein